MRTEENTVGDPQKHGEYLVTLMHCTACHNPMTARGPDPTRPYAGGMEFAIPMMGDFINRQQEDLHPSVREMRPASRRN